MLPEIGNTKSGEEYKSIEGDFHRDIMNICRRYVNQLNIISILGTLDMAKHETIELMRATKKDLSDDIQ